VNSKNPESSASLVARFQTSVDRLTSADVSTDTAAEKPALLIALSGGLDSVVLLSLAAGSETRNQCSVRAVYIDHGLQAQSVRWGSFCASLCNELGVEYKSVSVSVDLKSGLSPEAAARDARYEALSMQLQAGEYLCTAHHADDQAETLMLQLFRGAGVHGLASMPERREFGHGYLLRPLLHCSRGDIERYASDH